MNVLLRIGCIALPALLLAAAGCSSAIVDPVTARDGGFLARPLRVNGASHPLRVYVPQGYDARKAWPCIVFLHGAGECGTDGEKPISVGLGPAIRENLAAWPCVVVFPQKPTETMEWWECETMVLAALRQARREFNIDAQRVALTGLSQGGHGTWMIGARRPELWSRLAPVCAYGREKTIASRVAGLPIWAFHGERDNVVPPGETRAVVAAVRAEQERRKLSVARARETIYPDANHNSWDAAYRMPELREWLIAGR